MIQKIVHKFKDFVEEMKYNNLTIGTRGLRSNPEPVQSCEYMHVVSAISWSCINGECFGDHGFLFKIVIYGPLYMLRKFVRNLLNHRVNIRAVKLKPNTHYKVSMEFALFKSNYQKC